MTLIAGVDSSTQSCKVVIRDAQTGELVRSGKASHPDGTEVHPDHWWTALQAAITNAGGLDDVVAISVGGQQHGMVCLDEDGNVVRPALLWNDTRSAAAADELIAEVGLSAGRDGASEWAEVMGVVPVASFTITKLRWLAESEPDLAKRVAAVCLPHDWLSWKLSGSSDISTLRTDRSDASGTGYWSAVDGQYHLDYLARAFGRVLHVPTVLSPGNTLGQTPEGIKIAVGAGDNAAAAFGLQAKTNEVIMSVGTSGVVTAIAQRPSIDPSGVIAGFADANGQYLPLLCTLNGARVFDATAKLLKVSHDELSQLALAAPSGADGLSLVPYFEGERTPNLPDASASLHGLTLSNFTAENIARAAFEGVLGSLAVGLDELAKQGVAAANVSLIGGAAAAPALRALAPVVLGVDVSVPAADEYVANGAARQAAWIALETPEPPEWSYLTSQTYSGAYDPEVRERYNEVASSYL